MNKKMIGNLMLILTAMIWGLAFVAQRTGMDHIEPITFTAARMSLAAVTVGLVSLFTRKKAGTVPAGEEASSSKINTLKGGLVCGFFLASASIFQQMGIVYTSAGKAGFITALYILLVPVIQFVLWRQKNTWLVWIAVAVGVAGLYLLCVKEDFSLTHGDTLICISAFLFSGHILCCDYFSERGDPVSMSAIQFLTVAAISGLIAFVTENPDFDKVLSALIPILYCGILSAGVGYTLQMVAQRFTDPTVASLLMSLESVFAVIAGTLILHERMSFKELMGCILMFAAIILVQIPVGRKDQET